MEILKQDQRIGSLKCISMKYRTLNQTPIQRKTKKNYENDNNRLNLAYKLYNQRMQRTNE